MAAAMTLDLTELRNKVSKLKVNPRGNLWATGEKFNYYVGKVVHVCGNVFLLTPNVVCVLFFFVFQ